MRSPKCSDRTGIEVYATPRAFIGVVMLTGLTPLFDFATVRAATGFNQNNANNAARRSQAIMAQKTFVQEPVFSNIQAAPTPAKKAPAPLAV